MESLSIKNFRKARDFILAHANEAGCAWYHYRFEGSGAGAFLDALGKFQQANGGFGGLYDEFDYTGICLKSTETAVRYILSMDEKPPASHPLIRKTVSYLLEQYLPGIGNWGEVVVEAVNDGIHCHWCRFRGEDTAPIPDEAERIRRYDANEKACFAAFLAYYSELIPAKTLESILRCPTEQLLRHWDSASPQYDRRIFDEGTPYAFQYYLMLIPRLPDKALAERLTGILRQNPTAFMELDFSKAENGYVHLPCDFIESPENAVYPAVKELADRSLTFRMHQQSDDGRWPLGWSFGEGEAFRRLQTKYEAYRTLLMLEKLYRFGRIE